VKNQNLKEYIHSINLPKPASHKGQNGKLLVIGGSQLFHSSIFWSADLASRLVDMVHLTSPENENNDLFRFKLKQGFWNGIVVDWSQVESYIEEDDVILIGPGMERSPDTETIVNILIKRFGQKKWVIDGGALQMIDPKLLNEQHIITPHQKELDILVEKTGGMEQLIKTGSTIVTKGLADKVFGQDKQIEVEGGNPGLTKGGTGDVLAGLVAALYTSHPALSSAVVASLVIKKAGEELWKTRGSYYNASDLVEQTPRTLWQLTSK